MNLSKKTGLLIFAIVFPSIVLTFYGVLKLKDLGFSSSAIIFLIEWVGVSFLVSALISFILWKIFSAYVIEPIREFNRITKIINSGNLGTKVIYKGQDELGELAANINNIIMNLTRNVQSMANSLRREKEKEKDLENNLLILGEAQAKDQALLSSLGEGVVAVDGVGRIFLFNKAAAVLTGFAENEAIGKDYKQILFFEFEKEKVAVPDFISSALNKQSINDPRRIQIVTKDGARVPITQLTTVISDSTGRNYGVIVVLRNILRERQLDKLKDEFVSIASHELRTPMTAIKGLISMIFEGDYGIVPPQLKEPLSDVSDSTQRLIELVNDMLDVSRIEAGRVKYQLENIQIADLINEILEFMHPIAVQKHLVLKFIPGNGNQVQADPNKIKQIISNLISNSIKFTDHGSIELRYVIHDQLLIISVRDTGMGIRTEDQKKLFTKFQQVTSSQFGRPVGTGLGLYISREFAKKMGGDLWIANSQVGVGSVFSLSIPLAGSELARRVAYDISTESK